MEPNLIFSTEPQKWKDLQEYVKVLFNEMGFHAISKIKCDGARYSFEADVLAERNDICFQKILIECKYWETPVNQDVVFSLKARMDDIGATNGIIVSKNGFQSGAANSISNTSISLYNFEELIKSFESKWAISVLTKFKQSISYLNSLDFDLLMEFDERVCDDEYGFYSEAQRNEFRRILRKYEYLIFMNANMNSG